MGWSKASMEYLKWAIVLAMLAVPVLLAPLHQARFAHGATHAWQLRFLPSTAMKPVELRAFAK